MPIKHIIARQVFDAVGVPTVEVDMITEMGLFRVGVPSTEEEKCAEGLQLRDNVPNEFNGMGVSAAVTNINTIIGPELIKQNLELTMQKEVDQFLLDLDGTENRSRLGANAVMAVSMVVAKAGAAKKGIPLFRHISDMSGRLCVILPVPLIVILNGGILTGNDLPFREYGIMPTGASSFEEALQIGTEVYNYVKNRTRILYGIDNTYVGHNGGFSIPLLDNEEALIYITQALQQSGHLDKTELFINAAASDLIKEEEGGTRGYDLSFKNPHHQPLYSAEKLTELYLDCIKEFKIASIEDPFDINDWESYEKLGQQTDIQILANDLTQSNIERINMAIEKNAGTSVALRLNQSGTVTELIKAFKIIKEAGKGCCVIDRWGETEDLFLVDLVVGLPAGQVKCGAPARSERISRYNQILRIEQELGSLSKYAGKLFRLEPI